MKRIIKQFKGQRFPLEHRIYKNGADRRRAEAMLRRHGWECLVYLDTQGLALQIRKLPKQTG